MHWSRTFFSEISSNQGYSKSTSNNVGINKIITENDWTTMLHSAAYKTRTVLSLKHFLFINEKWLFYLTPYTSGTKIEVKNYRKKARRLWTVSVTPIYFITIIYVKFNMNSRTMENNKQGRRVICKHHFYMRRGKFILAKNKFPNKKLTKETGLEVSWVWNRYMYKYTVPIVSFSRHAFQTCEMP